METTPKNEQGHCKHSEKTIVQHFPPCSPVNVSYLALKNPVLHSPAVYSSPC